MLTTASDHQSKLYFVAKMFFQILAFLTILQYIPTITAPPSIEVFIIPGIRVHPPREKDQPEIQVVLLSPKVTEVNEFEY